MFISVGQLEREMGIDKTVGRFFVDREPPKENSFWKNRLLYISFGNGYISIPVYYDILRRLGIRSELLLAEKHIQFMERLMHFAILKEKNEISPLEELHSVRAMLQGRVQIKEYYESLNRYLDQPIRKKLDFFGTAFPTLNRADLFLYVLCDLPLSEDQWSLALRYWYVLHPSYLIMDDIVDYVSDKKEAEENIVIELGDGKKGFKKTFEMLQKNSEIMREINPVLADYLLSNVEGLVKHVPENII